MKNGNSICNSLPIVFFVLCQCLPIGAAPPITVETQTLLLSVDSINCRWSVLVCRESDRT